MSKKFYNPNFAINSTIFFFSSSLISAGGAAETATFEVLGVSSVKSKSPSSKDTLASTWIGFFGQVKEIAI